MAGAPDSVLGLVERFERNRDAYRSGRYNETQVRVELIDPLFIALGWDVHNEAGYAEAYKDVVHEDAIKVGGTTKAPDYCFRVGGVRKFFLEAKKPSVDIHGEPGPAYQLRRYAWSAKLPLSILTDFEELAVYDCRIRPKPADKPSAARTMYMTCGDYAARWDDIASVFSKEAILQGSFDKYIVGRRKRGTAEVDAEFLKDIETWREALARNIALRNGRLTVRQLNYAVQRTIDRIIFLRICEDRGVETYGSLQALLNAQQVYPRLMELFRAADDRYNSGLFHFRQERDRATPVDELTPELTIDDQVLKGIFRSLYYPASPYEFSVIPADILGNVYEQFLGKVIHLTAAHHARVEEKPEVKKAGGVYYTPRYIVDYIVEHTVGRLLIAENAEAAESKDADTSGSAPSAASALSPETLGRWKTPRQAARLRILDPACGSGSFLVGAYRRLLAYHRDWYVADGPEKHRRQLYQGAAGEWYLATEEKKRILLNNIYGVDIDPQAVEVTKLNLLLCVLEHENQATVRQLSLIHERALPDLGANIKCGNSLIGTDFYHQEGKQLALFDEETQYRINAFDWEDEFPDILQGKDPGFDAVIGNPPYVRIQAMRRTQPQSFTYFAEHYRSAAKGSYDIYVIFVERGFHLLNDRGTLGFILPSKFFATDYGQGLRRHLAEARAVRKVVDFAHDQVFEGATTYTCLLFLDKGGTHESHYVRASPDPTGLRRAPPRTIAPASLGADPWMFIGQEAQALVEKLLDQGGDLLDLPAGMSRGSSSGADGILCLKEDQGAFGTRAGDLVEIEPQILRTPIYATDFTRYAFTGPGHERIIFPYTVTTNGYVPIEERALRSRYPNAYAYLARNRRALEGRRQYREWYAFSAPRNLHIHERADFLVPLLADRGLCAPIPPDPRAFCVMASAGFTVSIGTHGRHPDPLLVLGLVNSKLLFWYLHLISNKFRGGWITCTKQYFGRLPIRRIDSSDARASSLQDAIAERVRRMIADERRVAKEGTEHEKSLLDRQIDATDREIDQLVYELYGLTDEEIAVVEGDSS